VNEVKDEFKDTTYELFIGAASILSIINLVLFYFFPTWNLRGITLVINSGLSLLFLLDFLFRLLSARSKAEYFLRQMGWADLLASLPLMGTNILLIFRILRIYRLRKAVGTKRMLRSYLGNRSGSVLLSLLFLMILVLEFGGLAILTVESRSPDANINNASDVLWYIYVTVTTIGYGDQYPVTNAGRIIGAVIMTVGVGLFGALTAYLAKFFIKPEDEQAEATAQPSTSLGDLQEQMQELKQMLLDYKKVNIELKTRIEQLDDFIRNHTLKS
jgi:hypothetical protein